MTPLHKFMTLSVGTLFVLAEGCTHKDLNDNAPTTIADNVEIIFDWSKAPDTKASSMVLYLYPDSRDMMNYWFTNRDGGIIRSYAGKHTAICHSNDDPYGHHLRNTDSHGEFEIYTEGTSVLIGQGISARGIPRAEGTEDEPLRVTPPSMIYGAMDTEINLRVSALPQSITFYPEELACRYSVKFVDVENLKNADLRIDATLSSLAGGYYPGRMSPTSEAVSHTITLTPNDDLTSLSAEFFTFGTPAGEDLPHKLCVYIALKDRSGSYYTFDVTDQINNAPDPRNVSIKIHGLKLPELPDDPPSPPEGGVSIEIDSWEAFYFDVKV